MFGEKHSIRQANMCGSLGPSLPRSRLPSAAPVNSVSAHAPNLHSPETLAAPWPCPGRAAPLASLRFRRKPSSVRRRRWRWPPHRRLRGTRSPSPSAAAVRWAVQPRSTRAYKASQRGLILRCGFAYGIVQGLNVDRLASEQIFRQERTGPMFW